MAANTMSVLSTQSAIVGRSASSKPFTGQPIKPARAIAVLRSRAQVVKASAQDDTKGPSKFALGLFGALAAAQLALLPAGPADAFNLFPKTATSQAARDKLNKKTSDLPTLTETGKELVGGSDPIGASDPKDVGKAIDKATPDVDLTKNPKSLGKDAIKGAKNALPDVSAVPTREEIIKKAKGNRGAGGSAASKVKKGGNPLSGVGTGLPQVGGAAKKAKKTTNALSNKANKTASKAASKVPSPKDIQKKLDNPLAAIPSPKDLAAKAKTSTPNAGNVASKAKAQIPSAKDIQKKLDKPLGALPNPKDLANKAKVNTPNADNLASKAKAAVPKPAGDLKSKIKNTPSATIGLMTFEVADLQGQNNQSDNYPSPGKGYQAGKPSETIGAIPDKITSPTDRSMLPDPKTAGQQAPGAGYGGPNKAADVGKAVDRATPDLPNPAEKAKSLGNPIDSVKGLFGQ